MAKSSLSPPVHQLLVEPVRHLLSESGSGQEALPPVEAGVKLGGGWIREDGLLDWTKFETYRTTDKEAENDEGVVAQMRLILQDKLTAAQPAGSRASESDPRSASSAPDDGKAGQTGQPQQDAQRSNPNQSKGGQVQRGKKPGSQQPKKKGGGSDNAASEAIEREIAELEAEEGRQQAAIVDEANEKKLSEEARAYDLVVWEDIVRGALLLQKAAVHMHRYFIALPEAEFNTLYAQHFKAFNQHASEFPLVFANLKNGRSVEALLQLAPILERYIADLYWSATKSTGETRLILRDLFLTPQLQSLLGSEKLRLLRSLIGTPLGLNIRNVGWHGFLGHEDFYPGYVSLMLAFSLSIPSALSTSSTSTCRPLVRIDDLTESLWRVKGGCVMLSEPTTHYDQPDQAEGEVVDLTDEDVETLEAVQLLVEKSSFIVPNSRPTLRSAIRSLISKQPYGYYQCLAFALPALEHCLRNRYVAVNKLPPPMLTAVMYEYYTTLDVLLSPIVETTFQPNVLREELGDSALTALCDFFTCPEGPRLRDRISHGEAHPGGITKLFCDRVLALLVRVCLLYDKRSDLIKDSAISNDAVKAIDRAFRFYEGYTSSFHTKDVLVRRILHYFDEWTRLSAAEKQACSASADSPENRADADNETLTLFKRHIDSVIMRNEERSFKLLFGSDESPMVDAQHLAFKTGLMHLPTLYLSSFDLSAIVQLRMIVTLSTRLVIKIEERYAELKGLVESRKARSRQRNSFTQLCETLAYYRMMTQYVGLTVEDRLRSLAVLEDKQGDETERRALQEKELTRLKQLLVCVEKQLSLLAQGDKWREVCKLFDELLKLQSTN